MNSVQISVIGVQSVYLLWLSHHIRVEVCTLQITSRWWYKQHSQAQGSSRYRKPYTCVQTSSSFPHLPDAKASLASHFHVPLSIYCKGWVKHKSFCRKRWQAAQHRSSIAQRSNRFIMTSIYESIERFDADLKHVWICNVAMDVPPMAVL